MIEDKYISIQFVTEKKEGHGEDAPPLLVVNDDTCAVGVFDGMGGAGATTCKSDYGDNHTKAYVASRVVAASVKDYLEKHLATGDIDAVDMEKVIKKRLLQEQENYPQENKSMLRSKLVRDYPTTMALVTLREIEDSHQVDSYWAGDSHCYLWNNTGFYQISKDDLEENNDPMENLHNDSPISNCICADREFVIHHKQIRVAKDPAVILCSSDGCFGYYQTPMHFEYVLRSCLRKAEDDEKWGQLLKEDILKVTGDDCSLSMIAVGFNCFENLKGAFAFSRIEGFPKISIQEKEIAALKERLSDEQGTYEKCIQKGWDNYKRTYMKYLNDIENGDA